MFQFGIFQRKSIKRKKLENNWSTYCGKSLGRTTKEKIHQKRSIVNKKSTVTIVEEVFSIFFFMFFLLFLFNFFFGVEPGGGGGRWPNQNGWFSNCLPFYNMFLSKNILSFYSPIVPFQKYVCLPFYLSKKNFHVFS